MDPNTSTSNYFIAISIHCEIMMLSLLRAFKMYSVPQTKTVEWIDCSLFGQQYELNGCWELDYWLMCSKNWQIMQKHPQSATMRVLVCLIGLYWQPWYSQISEPPHSLHVIRIRPCSHIWFQKIIRIRIRIIMM